MAKVKKNALSYSQHFYTLEFVADCVNLRFENLGHTAPAGESLGKFRLSAYVKDFGAFQGKTTAFNLSISDARFYSKFQAIPGEA